MDEIVALPMDQIEGPAAALRATLDEESLAELAASLKSLGMIHPILVKQRNGKYEVVSGDRRFEAAKRLRWETVPCIVMNGDDKQALETQVAENLIRLDLSPIEEAVVLVRMRNELGYSISDLVEKIGKGRDYVIKRCNLLDLPEEIQGAIHLKDVPVTVGMELARIDDEDTRKNYLFEAMERGSSARVVKDWVDRWEGTHEYLEKAALGEFPECVPELPAKSKGRCVLCHNVKHYIDMVTVWVCPQCRADMEKKWEGSRDGKIAVIGSNIHSVSDVVEDRGQAEQDGRQAGSPLETNI